MLEEEGNEGFVKRYTGCMSKVSLLVTPLLCLP